MISKLLATRRASISVVELERLRLEELIEASAILGGMFDAILLEECKQIYGQVKENEWFGNDRIKACLNFFLPSFFGNGVK